MSGIATAGGKLLKSLLSHGKEAWAAGKTLKLNLHELDAIKRELEQGSKITAKEIAAGGKAVAVKMQRSPEALDSLRTPLQNELEKHKAALSLATQKYESIRQGQIDSVQQVVNYAKQHHADILKTAETARYQKVAELTQQLEQAKAVLPDLKSKLEAAAAKASEFAKGAKKGNIKGVGGNAEHTAAFHNLSQQYKEVSSLEAKIATAKVEPFDAKTQGALDSLSKQITDYEKYMPTLHHPPADAATVKIFQAHTDKINELERALGGATSDYTVTVNPLDPSIAGTSRATSQAKLLQSRVAAGASPEDVIGDTNFRTTDPLGQIMRDRYAKAFQEHPVNTSLGTAVAGLFGASVAVPMIDDLLDKGMSQPFERAIGAEADLAKRGPATMLKMERLQELQALNAARLASLKPALYNQILAGQQLPEGAVVIGGTQREDLLDHVTMKMAQGEYAPPPSMAEQYSSGLI